MTDLSGNPVFHAGPAAPTARMGRYSPVQRGGGGAYRAARRHSRHVKALRFALPALALAGLATLWFSARFVPGDLRSLLNISGVDVGTRSVIMDKPRLSGFDGTQRAYDVIANTARQSLDDPKIIVLDGVVGQFGFGDGTATIKARSGVYNGNTSSLRLSDGVTAVTTQGYTAELVDAAIDVNTGELATEKPVVMTSADGTVHANAMIVRDRGKHVFLTGGVSVTYAPPPEKNVAARP